MNQQTLEKYLWGAATYLRGHIDAGDYKQFIFPLLFFKRICDVYDEEYAEALEESDGDKDYARSPEFHRFVVPKKHHWSKVREVTSNVGLALCKNHHWAMDRDIIAPGPDLRWHVSRLIDPRRSTGEKNLADLAGKALLLPQEPAFHPDESSLRWRWERVCA
jgi:predicted restriction endonuclease